MRLGPQFQKPDPDRVTHTLGYIQRPRLDPQFPAPMPSDPHRAPKNSLAVWPKARGKK
jgi:hypothetical protein